MPDLEKNLLLSAAGPHRSSPGLRLRGPNSIWLLALLAGVSGCASSGNHGPHHANATASAGKCPVMNHDYTSHDAKNQNPKPNTATAAIIHRRMPTSSNHH